MIVAHNKATVFVEVNFLDGNQVFEIWTKWKPLCVSGKPLGDNLDMHMLIVKVFPTAANILETPAGLPEDYRRSEIDNDPA